jgi:hypothetical protein
MLEMMPESLRTWLLQIEKEANVHIFCDFYANWPDDGVCFCAVDEKRKNLRIHYHTGTLVIGDFEDMTKNPIILSPNPVKQWEFRQQIFDYFVSYLYKHGYSLKKIFRGHQHAYGAQECYKYPIMELLLKNKNQLRMQCKVIIDTEKDEFMQYEIVTLGVAPDTRYGVPELAHSNYPKDYPGVSSFTTITVKNGEEVVHIYDNILPPILQHIHNALLHRCEAF